MKVLYAEKAVVDIRKSTDYCLNFEHEISKYKAQVFKGDFVDKEDKTLC